MAPTTPAPFGPIELRTADIGSNRAVSSRLAPDEDPVRVAFVLRDIRFNPLNQPRYVFGRIVPIAQPG